LKVERKGAGEEKDLPQREQRGRRGNGELAQESSPQRTRRAQRRGNEACERKSSPFETQGKPSGSLGGAVRMETQDPEADSVLEAPCADEKKGDGGIPPLRGPTRHTSARKRRSGRSGRNDKCGLAGKSTTQGRRDALRREEKRGTQDPGTKALPGAPDANRRMAFPGGLVGRGFVGIGGADLVGEVEEMGEASGIDGGSGAGFGQGE